MQRDAPDVRFFQLPSGQRMAYSIDGQGPPLVCSAWWVSHVEADWDAPGFRRFFSRLAERCTVVRYDRIGAGLSDREREVITLEEEVHALAAVVDECGFESTALFGVACAGPPAIVYAAENPERVSKLALWGSFVEGNDVGPPATRDAVQNLVRNLWGVGAAAIADMFAPGLDAPERATMAKQQRLAASAEVSADLLALTFDMSASAAAQTIQQPARVFHRKGDRAIPYAAGRELAATLPNATLKSFEGAAHVPWFGEIDEAADAILSFVVASPDSAETKPPVEQRDRELRRQGDLWRLDYGGRTIHLKHARGLADLAVLLAAPGEEIHVGRLWTGVDTTARLEDPGDAALDEASLRSYRERLDEIDDQLGDAGMLGDSDKAERLRSERAALAQELRAAVGLGGRQRALDDPSERARKAVTARIRAVIKKIADVHPDLADHLRDRVKTGTYLSYGESSDPAWSVGD